MEKFADTLKDMFQEKLSLYKALKTVCEQEKKYIIDMDVNSLWKTADEKNQLALKIEGVRKMILKLLEENPVRLNMGIESFGLSRIIDVLPFSKTIKFELKKMKIEMDILKQALAVLASENKRYTNEYLSVIDGIFATITGSENRDHYTRAGLVLKEKTEKYLIRAKV